jgi:hypothetical protein
MSDLFTRLAARALGGADPFLRGEPQPEDGGTDQDEVMTQIPESPRAEDGSPDWTRPPELPGARGGRAEHPERRLIIRVEREQVAPVPRLLPMPIAVPPAPAPAPGARPGPAAQPTPSLGRLPRKAEAGPATRPASGVERQPVPPGTAPAPLRAPAEEPTPLRVQDQRAESTPRRGQPNAPSVSVTIGRVEVRVRQPDSGDSGRRTPATTPAPALSLEEYLRASEVRP